MWWVRHGDSWEHSSGLVMQLCSDTSALAMVIHGIVEHSGE